MDLSETISRIDSSRTARDAVAQLVLAERDQFGELLRLACDISFKNHHKACWILELVLEQHLCLLSPFLQVYCEALPKFSSESALRPIAKIGWFVARAAFPERGAGMGVADDGQLSLIASANFDWLISGHKVATKVYAMRTLYLLGRRYDWIYPELKALLEKDFGTNSAAYRAAARQLLRRL